MMPRNTLIFPPICLLGLATSPAFAQDVVCAPGTHPCGYQIHDAALQRVPLTLKYQARVSQAQLPIGEGLFRKVIVNLKRGQRVLCQEEFRNVEVVGSVVNLEIGRNLSCELDEVVAENHELKLQVCLGQPDNCLRSQLVGTAPYALKATYALHAREAFQAEEAGQAHYGHRLAADSAALDGGEVAVGYLRGHTPDSAPALYDADGILEYADGGWLTWTPLVEARPTLHVSARDHGAQTPVPLYRLVLAADRTDTSGALDVDCGGGWTLVAATLGLPLLDQAGGLHGDLARALPEAGHDGVWDGLREVLGDQSDVRFACQVEAGPGANTVDLSFYGVPWYDEMTRGTDAETCVNEDAGEGFDERAPGRRNNLTGAVLARGRPWQYELDGYLESEDECAALDDFTIDFDDRGLDGDEADGTDWGLDDGVPKCGAPLGAEAQETAAWWIWVRRSMPSCFDGAQGGDELGIDCGGSCAAGCPDGGVCQVAADCESRACGPMATCLAPE